MPKIGGRDLISDSTDKSARRLVVTSAAVLLVKLYKVDLKDLALLNIKLPSELFDVVALALLIYGVYSHCVNWTTDVASFRLWYKESSIWSEINTHMKLDKSFYNRGAELLLLLVELDKNHEFPEGHA